MKLTKFTKQMLGILSALTLFSSMVAVTQAADDWSKLSDHKKTKLGLYMTSKEVYDYTMANGKTTLFIDTRTPGELNYLGAPDLIDFHVPLVYMDRSQWEEKHHRYMRVNNDNFVADVEERLARKGLSKSDTVILMCRSGKRSAKAVNLLADAGFTKVYSMVDGYEGDKAKSGDTKGQRTVNGWKNSGLPWTYNLNGDIMYFIKE
jgi:rhodanese-related sulfurtransferase